MYIEKNWENNFEVFIHIYYRVPQENSTFLPSVILK